MREPPGERVARGDRLSQEEEPRGDCEAELVPQPEGVAQPEAEGDRVALAQPVGGALGERVPEPDTLGEGEALAAPLREPQGVPLSVQHVEAVGLSVGKLVMLRLAFTLPVAGRGLGLPLRVGSAGEADCEGEEDCEGEPEEEPDTVALRLGEGEVEGEGVAPREPEGRGVTELEPDTEGKAAGEGIISASVALLVVEPVGLLEAEREGVEVFDTLTEPVPVLHRVTREVEEAKAVEEGD